MDRRTFSEDTLSTPRIEQPIPFSEKISIRKAKQMLASMKRRLEEEPDPENTGTFVCYSEQLTPELVFVVGHDQQGARHAYPGWMFELVENQRNIAHFRFDVREDDIDFPHRLVGSQKKYGITGSQLLRKTENYLRFLDRQGEIDLKKPIRLNAGQTNVIQWALKNGFTFQTPKQKDLFEEIITGKRTSEYVTDIHTTDEQGVVREGYMMGVEDHSHWKQQDDKRTHPHNIEAQPFSTRFDLIKHLKPINTRKI